MKQSAGTAVGPLRAGALLLVALAALFAVPAQAYIGPSFLQIPGVDGGWAGAEFKGWVRFEANYWGKAPRAPPLYQGQKRTRFAPPAAPRDGPGTLSVSVDKRRPSYPAMMELCARKTVLPQVTYAESSERARAPAELGPRPADVPEYFEYVLKDVTLSCPVVADAPEQAFVLRFADVDWRNFAGGERLLAPSPVSLASAQRSGRSHAYIVTWFNSANHVRPDQCPVTSIGPTEADYFAFKTPEQAAAEKAAYAPKGGIVAQLGMTANRGPDGLNVGLLPGIVPDPGQPAPRVSVARGLDLDGRPPQARDPNWPTYVSERGEHGIDNNLFSVDGCIPGFGPKGILTVTTTETRRNGETSMMLLISGIDNERNDERVDVTVFYSSDALVKSADGKTFLPGFTFRVSRDPERTAYFKRLRGRIVDGVVLTEPVDLLEIDKGRDLARFFEGRLRLVLNPDRTLEGIVAGYQDWRQVANYWGAFTIFEGGMGYRMPAVYNALRRAADGLRDPVTGEYNGISSAFDIEGVEAFLAPEDERALLGAGLAYLQR